MKFGRSGCREKKHKIFRYVVSCDVHSPYWTDSLDAAMDVYKEWYKEDKTVALRDIMMDRDFINMKWEKKQDITKWAGGDNNG